MTLFVVVCWYALFFWNNLYVKYIFLFFSGLASSKLLAIYIYMNEITPTKYKIYVSSYVISLSNIFVMIPSAIFFLAGGKNLNHFLAATLLLSPLSIVLNFLMPESPVYLYEKKKFKQLRKTLATFAKVNRVILKQNFIIKGENQPQTHSKISNFDF